MMFNTAITEKDFANFDEFFEFVNAFDRVLSLFDDDDFDDDFNDNFDNDFDDDFDDDYDDVGEMYPCDISGFCGGTSCPRYFQCKGKS